MCGECHAITKFIRKFEKREIMVMDIFCVHHFKNGLCCCNE
ncbi:hypothetical protein KP509_29G084500 [Ceratopteris richardii]|nr:hypothetical protein KP509_29G084500 [Ceratopteris richardii]